MPIVESWIVEKVGGLLAGGIVDQTRKKLAGQLKTPERDAALRRCGEAAVAALVEAGCPEGVGKEEREHLEEVLGRFAGDEELHETLAGAIRFGRLPPGEAKELQERFREVHAPEETLPGFDVERGVAAFLVGFIDQADEEGSFAGVIQTKALRESVRLQWELLGESRTQTSLQGELVGEARRRTELQERILERMGEGEESRARLHYLERVRQECLRLPVTRLLMEQGLREAVTLDRVYVELDTKTPKEPLEAGHKERRPDLDEGEIERLNVREALAGDKRVVILGDPGAGKSTFTRAVLAQLASSALDDGVEPPVGLPRNLVPVFVELRQLSGRLHGLALDDLSGQERGETLAAAVRDEVLSVLSEEEGEAEYRAGLADALTAGRCAVVFDGLDEVPDKRRALVREAVLVSAERFDPERLVVTCRVRSYGDGVSLPGFRVHELAPFDRGQAEAFCTAWYGALEALGGVPAGAAGDEAKDLARAALAPSLARLAENPLLLTTVAVLHTRKAELPRERVRVYEESVELLARDWQRERLGKKLVESEALRAFLQDDSRLWPLLRRLAFEAHRVGGTEQEVAAGLSEGDLLVMLRKPEFLGSADLAAELLEYADQRAGLLIGRGGRPGEPASFGFVHRTFQEYLAGRHLTITPWDPVDALYARAAEGDLWSLAVELGAEALLYVDTNPQALLKLAFGLGAVRTADSDQARRAILWAGKMAALAGREVVEQERKGPIDGDVFLEELRPKLVELLGSELPEAERVEAGEALGQLGDPRLEEPKENWVEIPGGTFWMGAQSEDPEAPGFDPKALWDESPVRRVTVGAFAIGRYPVTVQELRRFVEAGGYLDADLWEPEGWALRKEQGWASPGSWDAQLRHPNRSVGRVSWYEADAYCRWVGGRLPTEAEWEIVARGEEGRRFPWGGETPDDRRASFGSSVGRQTPVGSYPAGATPEGVMDLAGNVWEWCADWKGPYPPDDETDPTREQFGATRVLRGGSFVDGSGHLRAAYRVGLLLESRLPFIGFRVSRCSSGRPD